MSRAPLRLRESVALALLLGALGGCGDAPPGGATVGAAGTPDPAPSAAADDDADVPERPEAPEQLFTDRRARLGPWYEELERRFSPIHDGWPTEVVAAVARNTLVEGLAQACAGSTDALVEAALEDFRGANPLCDAEAEPRLDDGAVRIVTLDALPSETYGRAELGARAAAFVAPVRGASDPRVEAWVSRVLPSGPRAFDSLVDVRVAGRVGKGSVQLNARWRAGWSVPAEGGGVRLASLEALSYERVDFRTVPFVERTRAALPERMTAPDGELFQGALERFGRLDRLAGPTKSYLGMHGMAVGDVDGDGLEDLYVARHAGAPNWLLRQRPDGTVEEVARAAGVDYLDDVSGVLLLDLDGDADRDLCAARGADLVLAWNDGNGRFPATTVLPGEGEAPVYSISAADADGDGDLDLYATRYVTGGVAGGVPTPYHDAENGASNFFWRNDGGHDFHLANEELGFDANNQRFSLASIWEDLDGDGDLDLYVTNDFGRNNLYRNDGGRFVDVADRVGAFDMAAGMGISCADVELDGDVDLYVSNMFTTAGRRVTALPRFMQRSGLAARASYERHTRGNTLLLGHGDGTFEDATEAAGVGPGGWCWGAMFTDFDDDGLPDIVVPNGFLTGRVESDLESFFWRVVVAASPLVPPATPEYQQAWVAISQMSQAEGLSWNGHERNVAYWNVGGGRFVDVSAAAGLDLADDARVACVVDWDGDGRLDLWMRNRTAPVLRFLQNAHASADHWIAFDLSQPEGGNREAIGARVVVEALGRTLARRVYAGEGYLGGSSRRLHFGLAGAERVDALRVEWPDGTASTFGALEADHAYAIARGAEAPVRRPARGPVALAAAPEEVLEPRIGELVERVPALERLPFSAFDLPSFDDSARPRVSDYAGRCVALVLWAGWSDASLATLERLVAERAQLDAAGVALYPISMDRPRDEAYARGVLQRIAPVEPGGRADRRVRSVLEIALFALLGAYSDLPLPVVLLFDPEGALSVAYLGGADPEVLAADARTVQEHLGRADARWPVGLTGGRWIDGGPSRPYEHLAEPLEKAGLEDLARELREAHEARGL